MSNKSKQKWWPVKFTQNGESNKSKQKWWPVKFTQNGEVEIHVDVSETATPAKMLKNRLTVNRSSFDDDSQRTLYDDEELQPQTQVADETKQESEYTSEIVQQIDEKAESGEFSSFESDDTGLATKGSSVEDVDVREEWDRENQEESIWNDTVEPEFSSEACVDESRSQISQTRSSTETSVTHGGHGVEHIPRQSFNNQSATQEKRGDVCDTGQDVAGKHSSDIEKLNPLQSLKGVHEALDKEIATRKEINARVKEVFEKMEQLHKLEEELQTYISVLENGGNPSQCSKRNDNYRKLLSLMTSLKETYDSEKSLAE